jgi:hypothetical protein
MQNGTNQPLVILTTMTERVSSRGTRYLSGYLGKAKLVGFLDKDPDERGQPVWKIFVQDNPSQGRQMAQDKRKSEGRSQEPTFAETFFGVEK